MFVPKPMYVISCGLKSRMSVSQINEMLLLFLRMLMKKSDETVRNSQAFIF